MQESLGLKKINRWSENQVPALELMSSGINGHERAGA